ncbi:MAG: ParA family protein [Myxococcota bacterium]|nr:ParA family protein [Myxococcota bacterium]
MKRILAISNQKGGVGKTTTAINLSSALAFLNQRVLLIDMDPQGNASSALGFPKKENHNGISEVLFEHLPITAVAISHPHLPKLHLAPATHSLIGLPKELENFPTPALQLQKALYRHDLEYDYVIIDCPPALNLLTLNALCAAYELLIPLQAEFFALEGINDLFETIQQVRQQLNPNLDIAGILMTMVGTNSLCKEIVHKARIYFGEPLVFESEIPRNIKLSEAASHGLPIQLYDPNSIGSKAYNAAACELMLHHGNVVIPQPATKMTELSYGKTETR